MEYESSDEVQLCMTLLTAYLNDDNQSSHIGEVDEKDRKIILEQLEKQTSNKFSKYINIVRKLKIFSSKATL